jgi:Flp pilus assembly protein protease CpaA
MSNLQILFISFAILMACFFDFKSKKIPNLLCLVTFLGALILAATAGAEILSLAQSFALISLVLYPAYHLRAIGGGDYKFIIALSPTFAQLEGLEFFALSIFWGGLFGCLKLASAKFIFKSEQNTKYIPFAMAYLLGWISWLRLEGLLW